MHKIKQYVVTFQHCTDPTNSNLPAIVQNIGDAVTHARFVGSDNNSDGVVLLKIVQVLRTLMLSPEGSALSNESVCEIILSCFRICFETRLNGEHKKITI
jgi:golgi-specific brefeldin A-resistance guanine nucleotide exchange factor 1